jgi:hypothetical protein
MIHSFEYCRVSHVEQELLTLPEHQSSPRLLLVLVVLVVKLQVFTFLDPCCYVRHDFRAKTMFDSSWLLLFVFIYVCCFLTRYPYQMMFVSFNSNMTGVTCGAGTANLSGAPGLTPVFSRVRVALCNVL